MMPKGETAASKRLATYGTLAPGRANHHQLAGLAGSWTTGHVTGRLVEAGWGASFGFPGLEVCNEGQRIEVALFESDMLPDHWERLDVFEGPGYRRAEVQVETSSGTVPASIYVVSANNSHAAKTGASSYPLRTVDKLRYGDTDRQGHVNNSVFATFLETGRVEFLLQDGLLDEGASFVIARLELDFVSEVNWPGEVEIGTAVMTIGRSSFRLMQEIFQNGETVARAETVIVQMNQTTRKSHLLSESARQFLAALVRPAPGT